MFSAFTLAEEQWNVDDVLKKLKSDKAEEFVNSILPRGDWKTYGSFLDQIETATPKWLEVAQLLKTHTDAGASEALSITLAQAIKNNPEAVFGIMSEHNVKWSCSVPLIEPTKKEFDDFTVTTSMAVRKINKPSLAVKKAICLKELNSIKEHYHKIWPQ